MADPTVGPYATPAPTLLANPTGADIDPYTGMTVNWSGAGHVALRRVSNELASHGGGNMQTYFSAAGTFGPSVEMFARLDNYGEEATWLDLSVGLINPGGSWSNQELETTFHDSIPDTLQLFSIDAAAVHASSGLPNHDFLPPEWWAIAKTIFSGAMVMEGFAWNGTLNSWGNALVSLTEATPNANMLSAGYCGLETNSAAMRLGPVYAATIPAASVKQRRALLGVG